MNNSASTKAKTRYRSASRSSLPLVSALPDSATLKEATDLLKRAVRLKSEIDSRQEQFDSIKAQLAAIAGACDLPGFRAGLAGFEYRGYTSRRTLSKELLIENNVDPKAIAASYEDGELYVDCRIVKFDVE